MRKGWHFSLELLKTDFLQATKNKLVLKFLDTRFAQQDGSAPRNAHPSPVLQATSPQPASPTHLKLQQDLRKSPPYLSWAQSFIKAQDAGWFSIHIKFFSWRWQVKLLLCLIKAVGGLCSDKMGLIASSLGTLRASQGLGNPLTVREAKLSSVYPLQPHWTDSQSQSQRNSRASEVSIQFSRPLSPSPTPQTKLPSLSVQRAEQSALQGPCSGNRLNGMGSHNQPGSCPTRQWDWDLTSHSWSPWTFFRVSRTNCPQFWPAGCFCQTLAGLSLAQQWLF